jgi:hypothetical protein
MAFSDYEHCQECVDEHSLRSEVGLHGEPLPELAGYKALYVGDDQLQAGVRIICDRHLDQIRNEANTLRQERDEARAIADKLGDALEALHDEQNGPPLRRSAVRWRESMEKTYAAICEWRDSKEKR